MNSAKYFIFFIFLALTNNLLGQNNCGIPIDTVKIYLDENLDSFLSDFQTGNFKTSTDKNEIPKFIKQQLDCLSMDEFSIANPNEDYRCCCTSSQKLPIRKLLFFSVSKDVFLITYLTGGVGESTTILMFKLKSDKIIDLWAGYGFSKFKSKDEVIRYISKKRKTQFGLHGDLSI